MAADADASNVLLDTNGDLTNAANDGMPTYAAHNYLMFPFKYINSIEVSKANKHYMIGLPNQALADKKDVMFQLAKLSSSHIFDSLVSSLKDHICSDGMYVIDCEDMQSGQFKE